MSPKPRKREDYKRFIIFCLASVIVIAQTAAFAYLWYTYYRGLIYRPFWRKGNWVLIAIYAMVNVLFSRLYGGLRVGYLKRTEVFYSLSLATVCTNLFAFLEITLIDRWFLPVLPLVEMTLVQIVMIVVWAIGSRWIYDRLYSARNLLVIYGRHDPGEMMEKMNRRSDKYNVCAKINVDRGEEVIHRVAEDYDGVILWDLDAETRNTYLKYCFAHAIRCYVSPKISDIILAGSEQMHLFDTPLLLSRNMGFSAEQRALKRVADIIMSLILIVLSSPVMLLIAIVIKLYDRGPVIYSQERLTRDREVFYIHKFRSMIVDSEKKGARLAAKNDDRITPVGKVIRNLHLDELPQLFNVLKGDMSMVGPRPERQAIMEQYEKVLPEFGFRLKIKAGLTGYAQVFGKYNTNPYDKLKLDLFYIENFSYMLDLKILLMTVKIFFQPDSTEGVPIDQTTAVHEQNTKKKGSPDGKK